MKKYNFETSRNFDEMVEEYGVNGISNLDIGEEAAREGISFKTIESWEYENGKLEIYVED